MKPARFVLVPFVAFIITVASVWNLVEVARLASRATKPPSADTILFFSVYTLVAHVFTNLYYMFFKGSGLVFVPLLLSGTANIALVAKAAILCCREVRDYKFSNRDASSLSAVVELLFFTLIVIIAHPWYKPPHSLPPPPPPFPRYAHPSPRYSSQRCPP